MASKVLTKFSPNNNEIVVSVGKKCFFWNNQHVVDISDNKENNTRWLLNFVVTPEEGEDGTTVLNRLSMLTEIQRRVGDENISDLSDDGWDGCKILLVDENKIVDIKKPNAVSCNNRMVAASIGASKDFFGFKIL